MHTTLHAKVKGYIDFYDIKNEKIFIKGWCFHILYNNCNIRLKYLIKNNAESEFSEIFINNVVNDKRNEREDVVDFYNFTSKEKICCGWEFNLSEKNLKDIKLEMFIDNKWCAIFEFNNSIIEKMNTINKFACKHAFKHIPSFVVVDNFYDDVDSVRKFALSQHFQYNPDYHKGKRTNETFKFDEVKERFESILNCKIKNWNDYGVSGCFQYCVGGDQLVYHYDIQEYAAIIFLTPDAPPQTGTSFYRSKHTKKMRFKQNEYDTVFRHGFLDSTEFDLVDVVGNVYNRVVLFDAQMFHAASNYFGNTINNGRLFQIFFFDLEK